MNRSLTAVFQRALLIAAMIALGHPVAGLAETVHSVTETSYDELQRPLCTAIRMNAAAWVVPTDACILQATGGAGPDRITKTTYDRAGQVLQIRRAVGTPLEQAYATYGYTANGKQSDVVDANGNRAQLIYDGFDRLSQWNFPSPIKATNYNSPLAITNVPPTSVSYVCNQGDTLSGTNCSGYDYIAAGNNNSCPSGYVYALLAGQSICRRPNTTAATGVYICPIGTYYLTGTFCKQETALTLITTPPTSITYWCGYGYILSGSTCTGPGPIQRAGINNTCPPGETFVPTMYCTNTITSAAREIYNCPTGYDANGSNCTRPTPFPTANAVNTLDYEGYLYDANGNRTYLRKRDGSAITYQYDALNRNIVKFVPERAGLAATQTRDVYYGYDLRGLQTYARFDSAVGDGVASSYDALGRLKSSTITMDGNVRTLSYDHDANGNRTRLTYPDGQSFAYGYDGLDRMTGIDVGPTAGTGALISQAYDNYGRRGSLGFGAAAPAPACPSITAPAAQLTRYCYDPISRLQSLGHGFATPGNNLILGFGYNPASQIISETRDNDAYVHRGDYNVTRAYVANGLNQYVSAGPASFTYDPNGNLTSDGAVTYAYDIENRIVGASGAKTANLRYDPLGRLYEVNAGSASSATRFLYDGDALVAEYDGTSGAISRRYVHGSGVDEPLIWYEGAGLSNKRSLRANHQGSIIAVADGAGQQIGALTYDPYGIPGAANFGRFQYTGQIWLKELGVYHYKARAYSPTLGRFLQTDPIGYEDQVNLYAYVGNDPVNGRDPDGKKILLVVHEVALGKFHSKIVIRPDDQRRYRNDERFVTNKSGTRIATLGAGPQNIAGSLVGLGGKLISGRNRSSDLNTVGKLITTLPLPKGTSENQMIDRLFELDRNYKDDENYDISPKGDEDGYNSNSYVSGILSAAGYESRSYLPVTAPGFNKPLPKSSFEPCLSTKRGAC